MYIHLLLELPGLPLLVISKLFWSNYRVRVSAPKGYNLSVVCTNYSFWMKFDAMLHTLAFCDRGSRGEMVVDMHNIWRRIHAIVLFAMRLADNVPVAASNSPSWSWRRVWQPCSCTLLISSSIDRLVYLFIESGMIVHVFFLSIYFYGIRRNIGLIKTCSNLHIWEWYSI